MLQKEKTKEILAFLICLLVTIGLIFAVQKYGEKNYHMYETDTFQYQRAKVIKVYENHLEYDEELGVYLGTQELLVELKNGETKGEKTRVTNYLTATHNVMAEEGTVLIIKVDAPEGMDAYYTVYSYDRTIPLLLCTTIFVLVALLIAGKKGLKAVAALGYSLVLIVYFLIPAIYSGYSPIVAGGVCALLSTCVTLMLLNGWSRKTLAGVLATFAGLIGAILFFAIESWLLRINGFSSDSAENLILIQQGTGLKIKEILFVCVMIASLGAIMDVAMSIVSSLYEIYHHSPNITGKELFKSGMQIGKDMIGTMTNTLVLAFTGSALITLLIFMSYQVHGLQLWNSNYLVVEIAQGICGTFGVVITVPAASGIMAFQLLKKRREKK